MQFVVEILVLSESNEKTGVLSETLEKLGHSVVELNSIDACLKRGCGDVSVVFVYQKDGSQVIPQLRSLKSDKKFFGVPVVVVTGETGSEQVIETMKLGAFDHLTIPLSAQDVESIVQRSLAAPKQTSLVDTRVEANDFLIGFCHSMRHVEKQIGLAAGCNATVLVQGETGTGKDAVARSIYKHSEFKNLPLTVVDCTAVPEDYGSFESLLPGSSGTVILDEIGDLNSQMQALLVRALKEHSTDIGVASKSKKNDFAARIIATTQYDLISMVRDKKFREDLFYRLNVLSISLPPLRERGADLLSLAEAFLDEARPESPKRLSSSAAKILLDHNWPGNVRELKNLMYHLTYSVRGAIIEKEDLAMLPSQGGAVDESTTDELDYYSAMAVVEKRLLERALERANGSRAEAARLLGINRQLLYSKLKAHGLMN